MQPEKRNPGLTPMDWVKFLISAVVGLVGLLGRFFSFVAVHVYMSFLVIIWLFVQVAVLTSVEMPKSDPWVIIAILSTVLGYCAKTYFTLSAFLFAFPCFHSSLLSEQLLIRKLYSFRFQQNMATYQNLITQSMYDKQLDSGRGTLLHLCDDVIQQEVSSRMNTL